ncbi:MAG: SDR family oxidoreductase [Pseudomonadota bacterium]|nr:SDR family oxidoreductase [Pseudomonadota bacterium]
MSDRKVALVIHGMDALGTAICRRLQQDGFIVAATAPLERCLPEAWLAAQRDEGYAFYGTCVDSADPADCAVLLAKLLASHGRLDVLVHVAATPDAAPGQRLDDVSPAAWRAALRLALDSAFNLGKQAVVPMLERKWGRIVQVLAAPGGAVSITGSTANAALHGLTKSLALEVARHGVTVNTIAPGALRLDAPLAGVATQPPCAASAALQIPVGRLGEAAEVAAMVSYLVSDDAAFVTGALLAINGGQHMC